ncbi:hypothetical protein [Nostoc sp.]
MRITLATLNQLFQGISTIFEELVAFESQQVASTHPQPSPPTDILVAPSDSGQDSQAPIH